VIYTKTPLFFIALSYRMWLDLITKRIHHVINPTIKDTHLLATGKEAGSVHFFCKAMG
jgi:hypothetical protein